MRLQFDRTTLIFVLFLVIIGGIFGLNQFLEQQPPHEVTIAVNPLAEDWIRAAAEQYNAQNTIVNGTSRIQVNVQLVDDIDVWRTQTYWDSRNHPDMWLPATHLSYDLATSHLPLEIVSPSVAQTYLVWGGFESRVNEVTANGTTNFDWQSAQATASNIRWTDGVYVNMAINWPSSSMSGVAAILSATANYQDTPTITSADIRDADFSDWMSPLRESLLNARRISGNPASAMALRGQNAADFALLPEVQWLTALSSLTASHQIAFSYETYQLPIDFPVVVWRDSTTDANTIAAANSFAEFLATDGQSIAIQNGLRPVAADVIVDTTATLFTAGQAYGIQLELPPMQTITPPTRDTVDTVIQLLD